MKVYIALVCTFILLLSPTSRAEYDVAAVCSLVTNNVQIASIDSCQTFYTCQNGLAVKSICAASQNFDKDQQSCVPEDQIECYLGDTPCSSYKNETFVPIVGTCNGWIYCKGGVEGGRGECGANQVFKNGQCEYGECSASAVNSTGYQSICQVMANNKYFGSTMDCTRWQICRNNVLANGNCKNSLVYNPPTGECIYEVENTCKYVTGEKVQPDPEINAPCSSSDVRKSNGIKCSAYYECINLEWVPKTCADNQFYDIVTGSCVERAAAIANGNCNRCEFSQKRFVNDEDIENCSKYIYCLDGQAQSQGTCPDEYYFDENAQACVKIGNTDGGSNVDLYKTNHGSCQSSNNTTVQK